MLELSDYVQVVVVWLCLRNLSDYVLALSDYVQVIVVWLCLRNLSLP